MIGEMVPQSDPNRVGADALVRAQPLADRSVRATSVVATPGRTSGTTLPVETEDPSAREAKRGLSGRQHPPKKQWALLPTTARG